MLFEPATVGSLAIRNHIVKSATCENMATPEGMPTDNTRGYYERLAQGGAGLIVTGFAYVNRSGQAYPLQNGAHTDAIIPEWQRITEAVHQHGAKIALQIVHCGRQVKSKALGWRRALAPSAVPEFAYFTRPRAMTEPEIWQTIRDFGEAAARAKAAGFDAVQIHAAHGYLISGFLSPLTNWRRDDWGGDAQRRSRFLREVYKSVRQMVGPGFPVLCKLNVDDLFWAGLTPREAFPLAHELANIGLDGLEISGGVIERPLSIMRGESMADVIGRDRSLAAKLYLRLVLWANKLSAPLREAYFLPYAEKLKPTLAIPLILVGGIRRPETAERILLTDRADLISMARPLIREPGLPNRWKAGHLEPANCESCNHCLGEIEQGNKLRCYRKRD